MLKLCAINNLKLYKMEKHLVPLISTITRPDCIFEVAGNDMAPEYPCGCRIAGKRLSLPVPFFEWGETYLINTVNGPVLRRVNTSNVPGFIRCYSASSDQETYAPFEMPLSAIIDIYRVIAVAVRC